MREQVRQVLAQVRARSGDTFAEAGVRRTPQRVDDLLTIAGLQILWGIVNAQHQVLSAALGITERQDREAPSYDEGASRLSAVSGFRVGGTRISRDSDYVRRVAGARRDLERVVRELGVRDLLYMKHVDVVRRLAASDGR
jgi:hypothetical protein